MKVNIQSQLNSAWRPEEVKQEKDGTWTVDFAWCDAAPVKAIPTEELAMSIYKFGGEMERAGARHYAESEI